MAACTQYTNVVVSGAGTAIANGTYIPAGNGTEGPQGTQIYTKDGNPASWPRLWRPSGSGGWGINGNVPFPSAPLYNEISSTATDCPPSGTAWDVNFFGSEPAPSVIGTPAGPNCADPLERCAFAAEGESGAERFRRLVSLGYV